MQCTLTQPPLTHDDHQQDLAAIQRALVHVASDLILLPELFFREHDDEAYRTFLAQLAAETGACVVGGSLYSPCAARSAQGARRRATYNRGAVIAPDGEQMATYGKRHPYGDEVACGVEPGPGAGRFTWKGVRFGVLICADAWDSRCFDGEPVDCWCIVAETVSEHHAPADVRHLWESLAVARAFEYASYVAISDWTEARHADRCQTCGVSGFVDPTQGAVPFQPTNGAAHTFAIDRDRLHRHRARRAERHFLLRGPDIDIRRDKQ